MNIISVSYTHLDVYKRQQSPHIFIDYDSFIYISTTNEINKLFHRFIEHEPLIYFASSKRLHINYVSIVMSWIYTIGTGILFTHNSLISVFFPVSKFKLKGKLHNYDTIFRKVYSNKIRRNYQNIYFRQRNIINNEHNIY